MIDQMLRKLASLHHFLFGGNTLRHHEQMCLDAWRASLAEDSRQVLDAQLNAIRLVQRQAGGAKVCFYYRTPDILRKLCPVQPDLHAATVVLQSAADTGAPTLRVRVFIHRGLFFSIEFPKRPNRYMQQHGMQPEALRVVAVESHTALTGCPQ